jgi:hypothetical protein
VSAMCCRRVSPGMKPDRSASSAGLSVAPSRLASGTTTPMRVLQVAAALLLGARILRAEGASGRSEHAVGAFVVHAPGPPMQNFSRAAAALATDGTPNV